MAVIVKIYGDSEKINSGKSYKEYLCPYKAKDKEIKRTLMEKAKITICELRKWREENGYKYQDQDQDFFLDEL